MAVVQTAYATARGMGASDKVMLALFEAAIVESGFRNLNYGDRDSVGFLQQRASQGWPNPMDVPTATRSFVSKATPIQNNYATAGQLAQAIQRSAFPLKYDAVRAQAATLLAQVSGGATADVMPLGVTSGQGGSLEKFTNKVTSEKFWIRVGMWVGGCALVGIAIVRQAG